MFGGLVTAIRTLTILPVPGRDSPAPSRALPWFPLVGAALGAAVWGVTFVERAAEPAWPVGAAALAVCAGIVLTRALHLDGLADWADAAGTMGDRARRLEVMKDPRVGAFGVAAVVVSTGLKWCAVARLLEHGQGRWVVAAYIVSRAMQAELAGAHRYARPGGGTAAAFVEGAGWPHRLASGAIAATGLGALFGPAGIASFFGGLLVARGFGLWCRVRIGGVTGDLLGAGSEIVETIALFAFALAAEHLAPLGGWGDLVAWR